MADHLHLSYVLLYLQSYCLFPLCNCQHLLHHHEFHPHNQFYQVLCLNENSPTLNLNFQVKQRKMWKHIFIGLMTGCTPMPFKKVSKSRDRVQKDAFQTNQQPHNLPEANGELPLGPQSPLMYHLLG